MDSTETFFTKLKEIRESKEISLKEIAESTKINTKFLEAIESGDFDSLPTVYMRLFIRSYCEFIEVDPKKVLDDYEIFTVGSIKDKSINIPEKNTFDDIIDEDNIDVGQIPKSKIIKIVITLIIIISFFWFVSSITNNSNDIQAEDSDMGQNIDMPVEQIVDDDTDDDRIAEVTQKTIPELIQEQSQSQSPPPSNLEPYHKNNLIKVFSTELDLDEDTDLTLSIETLKKTKLNISSEDHTESYNKNVDANTFIEFPFKKNIFFDLENASDVKCSISGVSIDSHLNNDGEYLIRGSYEPETDKERSKLFISFFKKKS